MAGKKRAGASRQDRRITNILFMLPAVFAFAMVIGIPFLLGVAYSFTDWDGVHGNVNHVGLKNYLSIFRDPSFIHAFTVTIKFTLLNVVSVNAVAFLLALLVTSRVKARNLYRAGFFVPNLIGGIVLGAIWQFIFNNILPQVGKDLGVAWLSRSLIINADTVVLTLVIVNTWQYAGYIMMIFVAAIQSIPESVLEAARVDGASYPCCVRKIMIPLMANAFTISLFLTMTTSFKMYDINLALTNGGPSGLFMKKAIGMSELLAMNIYNTAYKFSRMAEGQAKAVIFFIVLMIVSVFQVTYSKRKEVEM